MSTSRTINVLLKIVADVKAPIRQRIQAAENVLSFESPEEAVARTKSFLLAVVESKHVKLSDRLEATRLMRRTESPKVSTQSVRSVNADEDRARGLDLEITSRRMRLSELGLWPAPPNWADDLLSPDYEPEPVQAPTINDLITALQRRRAARSNGTKRRQPKAQPVSDQRRDD